MMVLRKVAGRTWREKKQGEQYMSDLRVRLELDMPSVQCIVQQARLKGLSTITNCPAPALRAMLSARSPRDGQRTCWAAALRQDLLDLKKVAGRKVEELGCPIANAGLWQECMKNNPKEWKHLCDLLLYHGSRLDDGMRGRTEDASARPGASYSHSIFSCSDCGQNGFKSQKALDQHRRIKHGRRCPMNSFATGPMCPVCGKMFATRLRAIAHLSDPRKRSQSERTGCREVVLSGGVPEVKDEALLEQLSEVARAQRAEARKAGHTRPVVGWCKNAQKRSLSEIVKLPKRRLRQKTAQDRLSEWRMGVRISASMLRKRPRH